MADRYFALDVMRGFAAIAVVIYHSAIITNAACTQATCNAQFGYLAVDMFFALSGFVLSHNYDPKFAQGMSAWAFMKNRFGRLLPIFWLALAVGSPLVVIDILKGAQSVPMAAAATTLNAFVLPWNAGPAQPYAIALVRPAWSLFFELWVANLIFALFWRQLRGANLAMLIGLSLAGVVIGTYHYGSLDMGPVWATFPGGFPRVLFSFFLGVALRRLSSRMTVPKLPSIVVIALTIATFFVPAPLSWQHGIELACVTLVYPALILLGSRATVRRPGFAALVGGASYPLYLVHMPMLDYLTRTMHRTGIAPSPAIAAAFVAVAFIAALAISRYYDEWARHRLAAMFDGLRSRRPRPAVASAAMVPAGAGTGPLP